MKHRLAIPGALILIVVSALAALAENNNDGTTPDSLKDYPVYMYETRSSTACFVYHSATGEVDSFTVPHPVDSGGICCSADGKSLYVCTRTGIDILDTETRTVDAELPYSARDEIVPSPDGRFVALQGPGLRILNTSDYSVAYADTALNVCGCDFSADSRRLYCAGGGKDSTVVIIDIDNNFAIRRDTIPLEGAVADVLPSPDEKMWYLYRRSIRQRSYFETFDVETDSIIFRETLDGRVAMAVSPLGRYAFYAEDGDGDPARFTSHVSVFDTEAGRSVRLIDIANGWDRRFSRHMPIGEIVVSPDGAWLVVLAAFRRNALLRINLQSMRVTCPVRLPIYGRYASPTCQLTP